jgi:hypothetical protein
MMNRFSFASLLFACLIVTVSINSTDAIAQKNSKSKSSSTAADVKKLSVEAPKPSKRPSIDVSGLQMVGSPQSAAIVGDTVVSRDGKVKVVNTPTGSYFIVNQPSAAQRDTLNDWLRSSKSTERASGQKHK